MRNLIQRAVIAKRLVALLPGPHLRNARVCTRLHKIAWHAAQMRTLEISGCAPDYDVQIIMQTNTRDFAQKTLLLI